MKHENYIGIDISKNTLDFALLNTSGEVLYYQCLNDEKDLKKTIKVILRKDINKSNTLFCAEQTGHFGNKLLKVAISEGLSLWYESPLQISKSQGLVRGKNDKIDALRIAQYAYRFSDKAKLVQQGNISIERIKLLRTERELYIKDRGKYEGQLKQMDGFVDRQFMKGKQSRAKQLIAFLNKRINEVELAIDKLIQADDQIEKSFNSMISIVGIGKQTALATITETENFTKFEHSRQFVCHAGCAPFRYNSGKSIRSANKVSNKANKDLKKLFHMAALSAIQRKGELRDYYLRKVEEGKNKMSVINAIRAKLIARIFAVVKEERKYEKNYMPLLV